MSRNHVQKRISQSFSAAAQRYDSHATVQNKMAHELIARLEFFKINPQTIVDLGCGTGVLGNLLRKQFPSAKIINLDRAEGMIKTINYQISHTNTFRSLVADAQHLPLMEKSVDMVISNAMLQWIPDIQQLFNEVKRILTKDGLFIFTTFGPDTLKEWRTAWLKTDPLNHYTNQFIDMHDLGDALMHAGLSDPVMDMEIVQINYPKLSALIQNLKGVGSTLTHKNQHKGLSTLTKWKKMEQNYVRSNTGEFPLSWEIIHGHCFNTKPKKASKSRAFEIFLNDIPNPN